MNKITRPALLGFRCAVLALEKAVTTGDAAASLPDRIGIERACHCLAIVCKITQYAEEGDVKSASDDQLVRLTEIAKSLRRYYE